jgi:hypothetical protein
MGLTMSQRQAVTKAIATRYKRASRADKGAMDRRLAPDRVAMTLLGRSHTKPGSLLKDAIPIRAWAQWDDAVPGSVRPGRPYER